MSGTTVCPHCDARFKISKVQMVAHHGMVRCGHCKEAFDTRPNFIPDQLDLQFDLPVLDEPVLSPASQIAVLQPMTLAEQVAIISDEAPDGAHSKPRFWPWAIASFLLLLILLAQAVYFFRVELVAQLPELKPALAGYCRMLKCTIPLPQHTDLISIESSDMEANPANKNQITFNALLRNRAAYAQAFPNLELTLTDSQDQALARRIFMPAEYLPPQEKLSSGFALNHEISIKLPLDTTELKPMGYRLVLIYPSR